MHKILVAQVIFFDLLLHNFCTSLVYRVLLPQSVTSVISNDLWSEDGARRDAESGREIRLERRAELRHFQTSLMSGLEGYGGEAITLSRSFS